VAIFALVLLGDPITLPAAVAVAAGTLGVLLLSPAATERPLRALLSGWTTRASLLGIASGTAFAFAAVGYRGATLALPGTGSSPWRMCASWDWWSWCSPTRSRGACSARSSQRSKWAAWC
jgi:hypothetical protein